MPAFQFEPRFPLRVLTDLIAMLDLRAMVETGTGTGNTSGAAAGLFSHIHTVELHEETAHRAQKALSVFSNVRCHRGDSAKVLPNVLAAVDRYNLFVWLDGHYSGPGTGLGETECPVIAELDAVVASASPTIVVGIDDARMFIDLPPAPHNADDWPAIELLIEKYNDPNRCWLLANDALFWIPRTPPIEAWLFNLEKSKIVKRF